MKNYIRVIAIVLNALLLPSGFLFADKSSVVVLTKIGASVDVQLNGLIEGLTANSKVRLKNDSGVEFKGLLVQTTCGCLRPRGIDGSNIEIGTERDFDFAFVPTAGAYQQTCTITGIGIDDVRQNIITFKFKGSVESPVTLDRRTILPAEVVTGTFTTGIKSVAGVEIDYEGIVSYEPWMSVSANKNAETIHISWDKTPPERTARISIPLRWRSNSYRFSMDIDFIDELITVIPRQMIFRHRDGQKTLTARAIVSANGAAILPDGIEIRDADDQSSIDSNDRSIRVVVRAINRSRVMVEWILDSDQIERFRDKRVVLKVGDEFTPPMLCLFQK
jgi:hypothetical protein